MTAVLVTGVSRKAGIGAAVAARLRADGLQVVTAGWTPYDHEILPDVAEQVPTDVQCDLADPDAPQRLVSAAIEQAGPLSALVVVHTVDTGGGVFDMTPELIDRHLNVNVRATLLLIRAFAEHLRERSTADRNEPGRIVLFASGPPQAGAIAYAASKGAIEWITYSAATELGPHGITVNAVNPGPNQSGWMSEDVECEIDRRTPLKRAGRPTDAAALVSFLISEDASFINGQVLTSDGGYSVADGCW